MKTLQTNIIEEIGKLKKLKKDFLNGIDYNTDLELTNACLSTDILLVPLYWFWDNCYENNKEIIIEEYLKNNIESFKCKKEKIILSIIKRTKELDKKYPSRPFESYRNLLINCFPGELRLPENEI